MASGGRPSRIMRVERVEGATWEEAMPPLAPSDRSPTATPELNCSTIYPEVPPIASANSTFHSSRFKFLDIVRISSKLRLNKQTDT